MFKKIVQMNIVMAILCVLCLPVLAADGKVFPQGAVTVYHPFEPTPYDVLSQEYNTQMEKIIGVPFVFEYGMMGKAAKAVLQGKPDGQTLFFAAMGPMVLMPNMVRPAYGPDDFKAVARATELPIVVVAGKNAPFKTFEAFVDYARAHPGKVSIGLTNFPSSLHIGMTHVIRNILKLDVKLVEQPDGPLRGTIDCLIGETDMLISHPPDIMRYIKRGDFVPLVTFAAQRVPMLPQTPTLKELGHDFTQTSWRMLVVHKDTSDAVVEVLAKATKNAMNTPEMQQSAVDNYEILSYLSPEESQTFLREEFERYRKLALLHKVHHTQK